MFTVGTAFVYSAIQVTFMALGGLAVSEWLQKRTPARAATLTTSTLLVLVGLTGLALVPLPAWWTWNHVLTKPAVSEGLVVPVETAQLTPDESGVHKPADPTGMPSAENMGQSWPKLVRSALAALQNSATEPEAGQWTWPTIISLALLGGSSFCLLRLAIGLLAVRRLVQNGKPVADHAVVHVLETLCTEMGCRRPVQVCETAVLSTAATVGWRRPLILLPTDWRTWSEPELRAVLAHELAHIRRSDYAGWLVARLSMALHFYHPFVHWLGRRLQLQQELAADALGATFAGGRDAYLKALSQLALKLDSRPPAWPVRTFLPAFGTLKRRIQMLKRKDSVRENSLSGTARFMLFALIGVSALGVSLLRGALPAVEAEEPKKTNNLEEMTTSGVTIGTSVAPNRKPFDLSYLPPDAVGVMAFRPAALFGLPEMKRQADAANTALGMLFPWIQPGVKLKLRIEDIDEIVVGCLWNKSSVTFGNPIIIRTLQPFDWKSQLKSFTPDLEEFQHAGTRYLTDTKGALMLGPRGSFWMPDDRTVVICLEALLKKHLEQRSAPQPARAWDENWQKVSNGILAVAVHNQNGQLNGMTFGTGTLDKGLETLSIGMDIDTGWKLNAYASFDSAQSRNRALRLIFDYLETLSLNGPKGKLTDAQWATMKQFFTQLIHDANVSAKDNTLTWQARSTAKVGDVMDVILSGDFR